MSISQVQCQHDSEPENFFYRLDEPTSTSHRRGSNDLWSDHFATDYLNFLNRMSLMTSFYRPLLSSLLCCIIALGNVPALLHVATCHGHGHRQQTDVDLAESSVCHHGCHHHKSSKASVENTVSTDKSQHDDRLQNEEAPSVPSHDSDHCSICHSLANLVGVAWELGLSQQPESLAESVSIYSDCLLVEASSAIPQPRGPPTIA